MQPGGLPLAVGRHAFGEDPAAYDRARPPYPQAVFDRLRTLCGDNRAIRVLEIGPGTGQATRRLLDLPVAALTAVEPDNRLADHLATALAGCHPRPEILRHGFEDAPLATASFDLVVAATSFHWLDQRSALPRVLRMLRPGGWFAPWWTVFDDPDRPDAFHLAATPLWRTLPGAGSWPKDGSRPFALDEAGRLADLRRAGFERVEANLMRWTVTMDAAQTVALAATFPLVSQTESSRRQMFLDALAGLVERQFGGSVERRFVTALYAGCAPASSAS